MMMRAAGICLGVAFSSVLLHAQPACVTGTLTSYEALLAGCTVGPLTASNFSFSLVSSSGGPPVVTANDVLVTPFFGATFAGLRFSATGFQVTSTQSAQYSLAYTWDPTPDIRGLGDVLDPPFGAANVTTTGCVNAMFVASVCPTSIVTLNVSPGTPNDFVSIPPPDTVLGLIDTINLNQFGGTASGFDGIQNVAYVPEPHAGGLLLVALLLTARNVRRRAS